MDALSWWHAARDSLQHFVLPFRCLLCGGAGADGIDLCRACAAELPRNRHCCARCALPLAESAALCGQCQRRPPPWDAAWVPFRYAWPLDRLETRFKFGADLAAGRVLSTLWLRETPWAERPELIVPVPLHRHRLRVRGHNQALELARPLAEAMRLPTSVAWLLRERKLLCRAGQLPRAPAPMARAAPARSARGTDSRFLPAPRTAASTVPPAPADGG